MPTINPQIAPRHKATRIAYQKHRGAPILLRRTKLAQHILRRPIALALRVLLEQRFDHGGDDVARRDGIDADAVGAPFGGEVAAELEDGRFGGVVRGADEALDRLLVWVGRREGARERGGLRGWRLCRSWRRSWLCCRRGRGESFLSLLLVRS